MAEMKENHPLYSVEFILNVEGRGLTAHCCIPDPRKVIVQEGDPIEFIRPDKSIFETRVKAVSMFKVPPPGKPGLIGLVLPEGVDRDNIPYGSFLRLLKRPSDAK